jgi:hypothetical protein
MHHDANLSPTPSHGHYIEALSSSNNSSNGNSSNGNSNGNSNIIHCSILWFSIHGKDLNSPLSTTAEDNCVRMATLQPNKEGLHNDHNWTSKLLSEGIETTPVLTLPQESDQSTHIKHNTTIQVNRKRIQAASPTHTNYQPHTNAETSSYIPLKGSLSSKSHKDPL